MKIRRFHKGEINAIINVLTHALGARDPYTFGHSFRVAEIAARIAQLLGLGGGFIEQMKLAVCLHDVGKIGIPDAILLKEGPLPDEDFFIMQKHPIIGKEILEQAKGVGKLMPFIKHHHERFDGYGYPDGLSGSDIPLGCRIISIADAIDAMLSDRPYRKAMSVPETDAELRSHAGNHFDPKIVSRIQSLQPIIKGLNFYYLEPTRVYYQDHDTVRHSLKMSRFQK